MFSSVEATAFSDGELIIPCLMGTSRPVDRVANVTELKSVPGGIRTPNLLIRSQTLCPVELQAHNRKSQPQAPKPKL